MLDKMYKKTDLVCIFSPSYIPITVANDVGTLHSVLSHFFLNNFVVDNLIFFFADDFGTFTILFLIFLKDICI